MEPLKFNIGKNQYIYYWGADLCTVIIPKKHPTRRIVIVNYPDGHLESLNMSTHITVDLFSFVHTMNPLHPSGKPGGYYWNLSKYKKIIKPVLEKELNRVYNIIEQTAYQDPKLYKIMNLNITQDKIALKKYIIAQGKARKRNTGLSKFHTTVPKFIFHRTVREGGEL
jgi:hypothetical protein